MTAMDKRLANLKWRMDNRARQTVAQQRQMRLYRTIHAYPHVAQMAVLQDMIARAA